MRPVLRCLLLCSVIAAPGEVLPDDARAEDWKYPLAVAAGDDGTIYIADRHLPGLWTLKDGRSEVFIRASKRFRTPLNAVRCVCLGRDGVLYAGDSASRDVFRVDADGSLTQLTAARPALERSRLSDDLPFTPENLGRIGIPMAIALNSRGDVFVTDTELQRVWRIPVSTRTPEEFLVVSGPRGIAVDSMDRVWVLSLQAPQLQRITPDRQVATIVSGRVFEFPHQIALRDDGLALVSDGYARAIWTVSPEGQVEKWISGDPLVNPVGIAFQGQHLLIVDPRAKALFSAAPDGTLSRIYPAAEERPRLSHVGDPE